MGTAASAYLVLRDGRLVGIGLPAEVARAYLRPELLAGVKMNEHHDERGRFSHTGGGGGFTEALAQVENEIAGGDIERAVALAPSGAIVLRKGGTEAQVTFTHAEAAQLRDCVVTHNHPGGSGLNEQDLGTAIRADLKQIRAVTTTYSYALDRPPDGWPQTPEARRRMIETYVRTEETHRRLSYERINDGALSIDDAEREHYHVVMTRFAKEMGWTYKRTARP